jgi:hypothetical protein
MGMRVLTRRIALIHMRKPVSRVLRHSMTSSLNNNYNLDLSNNSLHENYGTLISLPPFQETMGPTK